MNDREEGRGEPFRYTYSAPTEQERREIEDIRRQYLPEEDGQSKIEELKALDRKVRRAPTVAALCMGVAGLLIFGLGMAMSLTWELLGGGIAVSAAGALAMGFSYSVHRYLLGRNQAKYRERILRLSGELLQEDGR